MSRFGYRHHLYGARQTWLQPNPLEASSSKAPQPPAEHGENIGGKLQAAIRETFKAREVNQISTRNVLLALTKRQGEPWPALWGRSMSRMSNLRGPAVQLARLLKPLGIIPQTIREPDGTSKGYKLSSFEGSAAAQEGTAKR